MDMDNTIDTNDTEITIDTTDTTPEAPIAAASSGGQSEARPNSYSRPERSYNNYNRDGGERGERTYNRDGGDRPPMGQRPPMRKKRKVCAFCAEKVTEIDYKDIPRLKKFLSERSKILPRRITGSCAKHQRALTTAVKRARHVALIPYVSD